MSRKYDRSHKLNMAVKAVIDDPGGTRGQTERSLHIARSLPHFSQTQI